MERKLNLFSLTWPIFIETFLFMLLGMMDTFILGHYSNDAVAAVGVANQLMSMVNIIFGVIATGTNVLVSQYLGAKDKRSVLQVISLSLLVNFALGIIFSISVVLFAPTFLRMMNLSGNLLEYGKLFLRIMGGTFFIQAVLMTLSTVYRSYGFMKKSMFITLGMNIINVIGNYILVFGKFGMPSLGVQGSAISTSVSRTIALIVSIIIFKKSVEKEFSFKYLRPFPKDILKNLLKIGIPSAGEELSYNLSQMVVTFFVTTIGTLALTTRVYAINIMMFIFLTSLSLGQATQIMVGRLVGAGDMEKAYRACLKSLKIGIIVSISVAIIFAIFRVQLFELFTPDKRIAEMGGVLLLITVVLEPGRAINLIVISCLKGSGDVKFPVYMAIISMWGICVLFSYILGIHFHMGLVGVWIAFAMDEWFRGLFMIWRWKSKIWQTKSFVKSDALEEVEEERLGC